MDRKVSVRRRRFNKPWTERCKEYFRNFLAFMFSNVGIIGLVVGYTVAGAFIFIRIEGQSERTVRRNVTLARNHKVNSIWQIARRTNILDENAWRRDVSREIKAYQEILVHAMRNGYDGFNEVEVITGWSFPGAFLYSLTVITTIGYGNVVPRTDWGKITTIIYAIIGMPLFLLYLSNIGDIMARSFKWLYAKICLSRCCPGVARKRAERRRRREELTVKYFNDHEGSESPEVSIRRENCENVSQHTKKEEDDDDDDTDQSETMTQTSFDSQTVTVPVTVCLAIMVGYIFAGTFLFSSYEKEWSTLEGSYFCFISLSTIGFGDFVPGKAIYSDSGFQLSSILGSMYLMVGMALIAMCFNLMQEEVIHKIRSTVRTIKYIFRCNR